MLAILKASGKLSPFATITGVPSFTSALLTAFTLVSYLSFPPNLIILLNPFSLKYLSNSLFTEASPPKIYIVPSFLNDFQYNLMFYHYFLYFYLQAL